MLRFKLLVVIVFHLYFTSFTQGYINYHKDIRKAEIYFMEGKLDSCIAVYKGTFEKYDHNFPEDLYLAAQISAYSKRYEESAFFIELAMKDGGLTLDNFKNDSLFKDMLNNPRFTDYFSKNYKTYKSHYIKSIDTALNSQCAELMKTDQQNNKINYTLWAKFFPKIGSKCYNKKNDSVFNSVFHLIQTNGYLGAKTIGVHFNSSIGFSESNSINNLSSNFLISILYHNNFVMDKIKGEIDKALVNGELHPRHYATLYDFYQEALHSRKLIKKKEISFPYKYFLKGKLGDSNEIDNSRLNIGLHTQKNTRDFAIFCFNKGIYPFTNPFN